MFFKLNLRVVQTQAIFEINVGKRRIRHRTIRNNVIQFKSCSVSDPTLSDIDLKNKVTLV